MVPRLTGEGNRVVDLPLELSGRCIDEQGIWTRIVLSGGQQKVISGEDDVGVLPGAVKGAGTGVAQGWRILRVPFAALRMRMTPAAGGSDFRK